MPEAQPLQVVAFVDSTGSPFKQWLLSLDRSAITRIVSFLRRVEAGNLASAKPVGGGVSEFRLNFGPGYRVYFGRDGDVLILLLGGGTKHRQGVDIKAAQERWGSYKLEKRRSKLHADNQP